MSITMKRTGLILGLALVLSAFLAFQATSTHAQTAATAKLRLISLVCYATEDTTGADEAYLRVNGVRVWGPHSMNDSDGADLTGLPWVTFTNYARIELFDQDAGWLDDDDHLGTAYAYASQKGQGTKQVQFTKDGANYTLFFEVR